MSDVLTTRDGLIGNSPRYIDAISPPYQRYLKDDSGAAINLTGVLTSNLQIVFVNKSNPTDVFVGTGTFSIPSATASQGLISYQYGNTDLTSGGNWYIFLTCQLLDEPAPRVFDPDLLSVDGTSLTPSGGTPIVTIQNVNLSELNGAVPSASNPLPVSVADGANVSQGSTTDSSSANTEIGLLKAIKAYLAGTLTVSGTLTATNPSVGTNGSIAPTSSTQIGASDGTNEQPLQVESSSNKNLRTAIYNAGNELVVDGSGNASVKLSAALPVGSNVIGHVINDASSAVIGHVVVDSASSVAVSSLPALPAGSALIGNVELIDGAGTNKASISAGGAIKVDNSAVTQPVSGTVSVNTLPSGGNTIGNVGLVAGSALVGSVELVDSAGTNKAAISAGGAIKVDNSAVIQPISASSLPLAAGAATSAKQPALGTSGTPSADVLTVQGAASMTALKTDGSGVTQPVSGTVTVQQSTASNLKIDLSGTAANATAIKTDGSGVTQPVSGTVTANAGTGTFAVSDQHSNITADYDTSAGTQNVTMFGVALPASGGAVAGGTSSNPLRTDPTGTTTQPVSGTVTANAGSGSFTVAQATGSNLHTVLDAGSAVIGHVIADSGSTMAVTQATASNLNAQVQGAAASGASNSGNPIKVGGPFNTTQPTVTNGQAVDAQMTARGAQIVATGVDAFSVTASAGTNLNTSALALESGGNLATLAGAVSSAKVQANTAQINGVAPSMGNGVSGTGVQRVTLASDSTGQIALAAGTAVIGHVIADSGSTTAVTSLPSIPTGSNTIGAVTQASGPWSQNLTQVNSSALSNTNPVPIQDIEQSGYTSATTPPSATNAGTDTTYTFSSQVSRVVLQNNTSANLNYAFDTAASAGSLLLVPGAFLVYPKKVTAVHFFTAAAQNINGTSAGNIVVLGAN